MLFRNIITKIDPNLKRGKCLLPQFISSKLGTKPGTTTDVMAGNRVFKAAILQSATNYPDKITMSAEMAAELCLPEGLRINVKWNTLEKTLRLGPFIGIYGFKRTSSTKIFSEQTSFFRKLCHVARKGQALAYIIGPDDVNLEAGWTYGHVLESKSGGPQWTLHKLPLPDVIYDRGLFPKGPNKRKSTLVRRSLRKTWGDKFFNPRFFDKWVTHQWLSQHPVLKNYLPETESLRNLQFPEAFFSNHPSSYLKPAGGSSGRGILRVQQQKGSWICQFRQQKRIKSLEYPNAAELWQDLVQKGLVNKTYIIQKDLRLAQYENRPFDIRVLMQKGLRGVWGLTGMAARVAGKQGVTTNLHSGGTAMEVGAILPVVFSPQKKDLLIKEIEEVCYLTCTWIERTSNLKFGEIAVDLGISATGKTYLIEMNAVPGRTIFRKTKAFDLADKAVAEPIEYALYLSGFSTTEN